ncbi:hypothetical protein DFH06DRAFT_1340269 [Mycena polygramma]|nr:hypothetical protein DFH06DRAFT_1340269 [Mycena polygramma]
MDSNLLFEWCSSLYDHGMRDNTIHPSLNARNPQESMFSPKKVIAKINSAAKAAMKKLKSVVPRPSTQAPATSSDQAAPAAAGAAPLYEVLYHTYKDDVDPLPIYVRDAAKDVNNYQEVPPYNSRRHALQHIQLSITNADAHGIQPPRNDIQGSASGFVPTCTLLCSGSSTGSFRSLNAPAAKRASASPGTYSTVLHQTGRYVARGHMWSPLVLAGREVPKPYLLVLRARIEMATPIASSRATIPAMPQTMQRPRPPTKIMRGYLAFAEGRRTGGARTTSA